MSKLVPTILPDATIGILGGGQLGRMMAMAAKQMGYRVICLDPQPHSPCGQVCDLQIQGSFDDITAARELAMQSDVVVYEFENISADVVAVLEREFHVPQGSRLLAITQDRIKEKGHLSRVGIPVAPYRVVECLGDVSEAAHALSYPVVLKSATGGYDGKGQVVLYSAADLPRAQVLFGSAVGGGRSSPPVVLEKFLRLAGEISVIVARRVDGEARTFPVGENVHRHNILHTTVVPARISSELEQQAITLALKIADSLDVVGLLAVEMFLTPEGLLVNELAPRPHNSGHYTLGACYTSQFEQFVRAVCNLPLGPTALLHPAVMVNVLGEHIEHLVRHLPLLPANVKFHLYGKSGVPVAKRKMGHLLINTSEPAASITWAEDLLTGRIGASDCAKT